MKAKEIIQKVEEKTSATEKQNQCKSLFLDIENSVYQNAIQHLECLNIVSGRESQLFFPSAFITRSEVLKISILSKNRDIINPHEKNNWEEKYETIGRTNTIITGYADKKFKGHQLSTQAESIAMLMRAFKKDDFSTSKNHWIDPLIKKVKNEPWFPKNFSPELFFSREEFAKIVSDFLLFQEKNQK